MGKIPQYQRSRLASSVVGTPGVDLSAAETTQTFSKVASNIGSNFMDIAVQRQEALDSAEALKLSSDLQLQTFKIFDEHTKQYASSQANKTNISKSNLVNQLNGVLETASSDRVRNKVNVAGNQIINTTIQKEFSWAREQESYIAFENLNQTISNRANEAYVAGRTADFETFSELMAGTPAILNVSRGILSAEQQTKLDTLAPEAQVEGYIQGAMEDNPAIISQQLQSGALDFYRLPDGSLKQLLKPEQKQKYLDIAKNRVSKMADQAEYNRLTTALATHDDLAQKFLNNELTLPEIESLEDPQAKKVFLNLYQKDNPLTNEEKAATVEELYQDYYQMAGYSIDDKKGVPKKVKLEKLLAFKQKLYENFDALNDTQRNQYLKDLLPAIESQIKRGGGKIPGDFPDGYKAIEDWVSQIPDGVVIGGQPYTQDRAKLIKNTAMTEYVRLLKQSVGQKNEFGQPVGFSDVIAKVKKTFFNPAYSNYKVGDVVTNREGKSFVVRGFDQITGEPKLTLQ